MTEGRAIDASYLFEEKCECYSHEYERYLDFFKHLAHSPVVLEVTGAPACWIPLIRWLGHRPLASPRVVWPEDAATDWMKFYDSFEDKRRAVEISTECRPELVHGLFLADTEWSTPLVAHGHKQSFMVTGNGSLYRPEILHYIDQLREFIPKPGNAVLCPCAADKPYPADLHKHVLRIIERLFVPKDWHIIVATGVLGLVPQELWPKMPWYDSGLPYQHRVSSIVAWYFTTHVYRRVVVYSDFYAEAISIGMSRVPLERRPKVTYIFGNHYRTEYANLLLHEHLLRLEAACHTEA